MYNFTRPLCVSMLLLASFACSDGETAKDTQSAVGGAGGVKGTTTPTTSTAAGQTAAPAQAVGGAAVGSGGAAAATTAGGATVSGGATSAGGTTASSTKSGFGGSTSTLPATGGTMSDSETPVAVHGQLKVVGTKLVDSKGAEVQLKGPSSMWLNWEKTGFAADEATMTHLRNNWKATVIRAAMGVEPSGSYNSDPEGMETKVKAVVDLAIKLGIYVIIDWHNHDEAKDPEHATKAAAFFTKMATLYGDKPNVLYETFNEPLKVDWSTVLKPFHTTVVQAIRAVDPDNVIILGTPQWSQRVDQAAADPVVGDNLMYTLHFYSCSHKAAVRAYGTAALTAGLPLFVTEWGATNADGGTAKNPDLCLTEADLWLKWMKENKISWAAWKFDDCGDSTCYFRAGTKLTETANEDKLWGHSFYVRDRMREE